MISPDTELCCKILSISLESYRDGNILFLFIVKPVRYRQNNVTGTIPLHEYTTVIVIRRLEVEVEIDIEIAIHSFTKREI